MKSTKTASMMKTSVRDVWKRITRCSMAVVAELAAAHESLKPVQETLLENL
jgi:hypothetical protein